MLDDLSSHTFLATQKDKFGKRHDGTCQWVLNHETFQRWLNGTENSTLWCYGDREFSLIIMSVRARMLNCLKAGSGKTILTYVSTRTSFFMLVVYQSHPGNYTL